MLEIFVIVYGLIAMVRGKFSLGGNKILFGWRARVTAGVLLSYLPLAFFSGLMIGIVAPHLIESVGAGIGISIFWLLTIGLITLVVGNVLFKGQMAERERPRSQEVTGYNPNPNPNIDPDSPYRPPRSG